MSLAVPHASVSFSLVGTGEQKNKKKRVLTSLVYTCVCVHGAPVLSADPGQDNKCEAMSVFCTIFGDAFFFSSYDSLFSLSCLFLSAHAPPIQLIH